MTMITAKTVAGGRLIVYRIKNRDVVGLKAIRHGKDHINHYFVPLEPLSDDPLTVLYMDYAAEVRDCHDTFNLELIPLAADAPVDVGAILSNETGTYLKAREPTKGIMSFVYVNLNDGEMRRRQERQIGAVYRWSLARIGTDPQTGCPLPQDSGLSNP
ncbi:MAG: hypothetical protein FD149_2074 [Rhodospirillaceae bacterium]|nr:MAG: hypothetical protein FD149_2074 [Rhodospirillaceae bacterium]